MTKALKSKATSQSTFDVQTFFDNFEMFADAPNAVTKMRELILQRAVQGKLVPQDKNDEPAITMIDRIKKREQQEKRQGTGGELLPIVQDEHPFKLPCGWEWERLGNFGETNIGLTYSPSNLSNSGVPVLRSSNIQNGKFGSLRSCTSQRCTEI